MPSMAEARAYVATVRGAEATLHVGASEATQDGALLSVETADDGFEAALAQNGKTQVSAFEILLDGVTVDMNKVTGNISVTRSYDQRLQTWNFALILTTPTGPLGSPFNCLGPATGKRKVTINGVYKIISGPNAGTVVKVPIIKDGIADNSTREASGEGTYTETISGVDRGGRYDQEVVTLVLPPGHGFPRGRVAKLLANRAGETQTNLQDGNPMMKEVQVVDGDWLSVASEQQECENRRLLWDTSGYLINPQIGRPRGGESAWITLDERNWLDLSVVSVSHRADALTDVTLTGVEQMLDGPCGLEDEPPQETRKFADYSRQTPTYSATTGDPASFSANPLSPDPVVDERMVELVRYSQTLRCGTLVYERTETYGWKNPAAIRQVYDSANQEWDHQTCFTNDNDDDSRDIAYQFGIEQWTITNVTESWHFYYQDGYLWDWEVSVSPGDPEYVLAGLIYLHDISLNTGLWTGPYVGFYLGSITRVSGYTFARAAVYNRDTSLGPPPYDPWDDLEPISGVGLIGDEGCMTSPTLPFDQVAQSIHGSRLWPAGLGTAYGEAFLPLSETIRTFRADEDGKLYEETETTYAWAHGISGIGASYKYGNGDESPDANDTWRESAITDIIYVSTGEGQHKSIQSDYVLGELVGGSEKTGLAGDRPAVQQMENYSWPEDEYESDEEFDEFAGLAKRSHTRQIKVRVTAPGLLTCHTNGILKTDVPLAENEDELKQIGRWLIDESIAADVQGTVLFNAYLQEAQVIRVRHRPIGLDHDVRIQSVTHSGPPEGPITTAITAKLYGGVQTTDEEL